MLIATILKTKESAIISNNTFNYLLNCASNTCPDTKLQMETSKPNLLSVYGLCGALFCLCIIAIIISAIFMDNISETGSGVTDKRKVSGKYISEYEYF